MQMLAFICILLYNDQKKGGLHMRCPRCGSDDIQFLSNTQSQNRGCLSWLFWVIIAFFTFGIGLLFLFFMGLTNKKTLTKTRAVCKKCGNQWEI